VTGAGATPRRQHMLGKLVALQWRLGTRRLWSVHALRHAFCSHLVRVGIGVEAVRALAGHSSIRVTNRYVHATGVDLRRAMGRGFRRAAGD
jgi:site-specific recombinase XerD